MTIRDIMDKELILADLKSELCTDALRELVELIASRRGLTPLESEQCLFEVLRRHDRFPSGLGRGLAFPNARLTGIEKPLMAIGLSRDGLDFQAPDGRLAHVIFLYLGRAIPPPEERRMLTRLSASLSHSKNAERLMAASTVDELWETVMSLDAPEQAILR